MREQNIKTEDFKISVKLPTFCHSSSGRLRSLISPWSSYSSSLLKPVQSSLTTVPDSLLLHVGSTATESTTELLALLSCSGSFEISRFATLSRFCSLLTSRFCSRSRSRSRLRSGSLYRFLRRSFRSADDFTLKFKFFILSCFPRKTCRFYNGNWDRLFDELASFKELISSLLRTVLSEVP